MAKKAPAAVEHQTEQGQCILAHMKRKGLTVGDPVTFGDLVAIEEHYAMHGAPVEDGPEGDEG